MYPWAVLDPLSDPLEYWFLHAEELKVQHYQQVRGGDWKSKKKTWDTEQSVDHANWSGEEDGLFDNGYLEAGC